MGREDLIPQVAGATAPPPAYEAAGSSSTLSNPVRKMGDNVVSWNGRLVNEPKWYQSYQVTRTIGYSSLIGSLAAGFVTRGAYYSFTAKPIIVKLTVYGLGGTTGALALIGLYCLVKHCWNDPKFLAEQGEKIKNDITTHNLSYREIKKEYPLLDTRFGFTDADYNNLFRERIFSDDTTYGELEPLVKGLTLDEENKNKLAFKRINDVYIPAYRKLDKGEIDYETFLREVKSVNHFKTGLNPVIFNDIRGKAVAYYISQNLGVYLASQRLDAHDLEITMEFLIRSGGLDKDLVNPDYKTFRNKHSPGSFQYIGDKDSLKAAFLKSYKVMRTFCDDAPLLGLDGAAELRKRFDREMERNPTFDQLIDRMGYSIFSDGFLTKEDPRLRKMLLAHLPLYPYNSVDRILNSYDLLQEDVKAIVNAAVADEKRTIEIYTNEESALARSHNETKRNKQANFESNRSNTLNPLALGLQNISQELEIIIARRKELESKIQQAKQKAQNALAVPNRAAQEVMRLEKKITASKALIAQIPEIEKEIGALKKEHEAKKSELEAAENKEAKGFAAANALLEEQEKLKGQLKKIKENQKSLEDTLERATKAQAELAAEEVALQEAKRTPPAPINVQEVQAQQDLLGMWNKELGGITVQERNKGIELERTRRNMTGVKEGLERRHADDMAAFESHYERNVNSLHQRRDNALSQIQAQYQRSLAALKA